MTIQISEDTAEAALRAASRSGYKELVTELLSAGVKASSQEGVAVTLAEYYGHSEVAEILRTAISNERRSGRSAPSLS